MKVVFLDIDGVLNSDQFYRCGYRKTRAGEVYRANHIDPLAVPLLNKLLDRSGAKCVLSSTWRILFGVDGTLAALRAHGFTGEIIAATPDCAQRADDTGLYLAHERGHEIQEWLSAHPEVEAFIILDDSKDMAHLMPRLVRTCWQHGLEHHHVERAIEMLAESRTAT